MAVVIGLFLATMCVIKRVSRCLPLSLATAVRCACRSRLFDLDLQRQEEERFKKIDAKRGGRGFV